MNNQEKKQWVIRYIKKNNLDDLLQMNSEKERFLKKYSDEIQSICAVFSALLIGMASIFLSIQNNEIAKIQTQIMRSEQKPNINVFIETVNNDLVTLSVVNKGTDARDCRVEIVPYLNIICNENNLGTIPIRVHFLPSGERIEYRNIDKIADIILYNANHSSISILDNALYEIPKQYTDLMWVFSYSYLIKVSSSDIMEETNIDYFIYAGAGVRRISGEEGEEIETERYCMIEEDYGTRRSKETFFQLENNSAEDIFRYALKKIRNENLYEIDFQTQEKVLYGEYEP